jgi:hypothetical protein
MAAAPKKIFISYRRSDSQWPADRLKQVIAAHVPDPSRDIFMDIDNIPLGVNFVDYLDTQVKQCDVLLALIGQGWLNATTPGESAPRLNDPKDIVRNEIAIALKRGIPVVPVLLDGVAMPTAAELPGDLSELALRNGVEVRRASFEADAARLVRGLGLSPVSPAAQARPATPLPEADMPAKGGKWIAPVAIAALLAAGAGGAYMLTRPPPALVETLAESPTDASGGTEAPAAANQEPPAENLTDDQAFNAWSASSYSYCEARLLAPLWKRSIYDAKIAMGRKIAADNLAALDEAVTNAYAGASANATGERVCAFEETQFTPADAAALAKVWGVSLEKAKREIEGKITLNGLTGVRIMQDTLAAKP